MVAHSRHTSRCHPFRPARAVTAGCIALLALATACGEGTLGAAEATELTPSGTIDTAARVPPSCVISPARVVPDEAFHILVEGLHRNRLYRVEIQSGYETTKTTAMSDRGGIIDAMGAASNPGLATVSITDTLGFGPRLVATCSVTVEEPPCVPRSCDGLCGIVEDGCGGYVDCQSESVGCSLKQTLGAYTDGSLHPASTCAEEGLLFVFTESVIGLRPQTSPDGAREDGVLGEDDAVRIEVRIEEVCQTVEAARFVYSMETQGDFVQSTDSALVLELADLQIGTEVRTARGQVAQTVFNWREDPPRTLSIRREGLTVLADQREHRYGAERAVSVELHDSPDHSGGVGSWLTRDVWIKEGNGEVVLSTYGYCGGLGGEVLAFREETYSTVFEGDETEVTVTVLSVCGGPWPSPGGQFEISYSVPPNDHLAGLWNLFSLPMVVGSRQTMSVGVAVEEDIIDAIQSASVHRNAGNVSHGLQNQPLLIPAQLDVFNVSVIDNDR